MTEVLDLVSTCTTTPSMNTLSSICQILGNRRKLIPTQKLILQAPQNLHPFVWRFYFNTFLLVRIPGLFCVRGMFKIFVGKNCRICQLYWCFHQSICSKTRERDLRNCPQHPQRDLSKGDTVWWALPNCMFLGGQWDIKRWACVWSRVVQICGVLPCLPYKLIATPQGGCSARKRPVKYGQGENRLETHSFKPQWRTWSTFSYLSQWWNRNTFQGTQGILGSLICLLVSHLWWS